MYESVIVYRNPDSGELERQVMHWVDGEVEVSRFKVVNDEIVYLD